MEHINKLTKDMLKNLGPNITENTALPCSRSVAQVKRLLTVVDCDLTVKRAYGYHKVLSSECDFRSLVHELHVKGKVFKFDPSEDREYLIFKTFSTSSLLKCLKLSNLKK